MTLWYRILLRLTRTWVCLINCFNCFIDCIVWCYVQGLKFCCSGTALCSRIEVLLLWYGVCGFVCWEFTYGLEIRGIFFVRVWSKCIDVVIRESLMTGVKFMQKHGLTIRRFEEILGWGIYFFEMYFMLLQGKFWLFLIALVDLILWSMISSSEFLFFIF